MFIGGRKGYYGSFLTSDLVSTTPILYVILFFVFPAIFLLMYFIREVYFSGHRVVNRLRVFVLDDLLVCSCSNIL